MYKCIHTYMQTYFCCAWMVFRMTFVANRKVTLRAQLHFHGNCQSWQTTTNLLSYNTPPPTIGRKRLPAKHQHRHQRHLTRVIVQVCAYVCTQGMHGFRKHIYVFTCMSTAFHTSMHVHILMLAAVSFAHFSQLVLSVLPQYALNFAVVLSTLTKPHACIHVQFGDLGQCYDLLSLAYIHYKLTFLLSSACVCVCMHLNIFFCAFNVHSNLK